MATSEPLVETIELVDEMREQGVSVDRLWPEDTEVPDGYFVLRQFTAVGRDLNTLQDYGTALTVTDRSFLTESVMGVSELVRWLRESLRQFERANGVHLFIHEISYSESLVEEPDGDE